MPGSNLLRIKEALSPVTRPSFAQSGGFETLDNIDVKSCVSAAENGGESIWGISVNLMVQVTGPSDPRKILKKVLTIAENLTSLYYLVVVESLRTGHLPTN